MSDVKEFKYGWPVVTSSALGIGLGMSPLPFYTIGVFIAPFSEEFGWRVDQILFAISIFSLTALFTSPLIGYITDRIGVRKMVLVSIFTFSMCFMAFCLNNGSLWVYMSLWVALAFFGSGTLPITWTKAVNRWFIKKRGLALGLSLLGTGLFGALAKQYASFFIENYGWRTAYIALALLPLLIALPVAFFLFRDTNDPKVADKVKRLKEELPYYKNTLRSQEEKYNQQASDQSIADAPDPSLELPGLSLKASLKGYRFWILALSFIPISFAIGGPIPNFEKILDTKGFSTTVAVDIASAVGIAVVVGRLVGGYLLDKLWAPGVSFVIFIIPIFACMLFRQPDLSYGTAIAAVSILGLAAGVEYDLMAFLVSKYFGMKNYSTIYGTLYGFFAIGAGFGPWLFGKSFTMTGSYDTIFLYAMFAFVIGAIPLLFLGKYQFD